MATITRLSGDLGNAQLTPGHAPRTTVARTSGRRPRRTLLAGRAVATAALASSLLAPAVVFAQPSYDGSIAITGYYAPGGAAAGDAKGGSATGASVSASASAPSGSKPSASVLSN